MLQKLSQAYGEHIQPLYDRWREPISVWKPQQEGETPPQWRRVESEQSEGLPAGSFHLYTDNGEQFLFPAMTQSWAAVKQFGMNITALPYSIGIVAARVFRGGSRLVRDYNAIRTSGGNISFTNFAWQSKGEFLPELKNGGLDLLKTIASCPEAFIGWKFIDGWKKRGVFLAATALIFPLQRRGWTHKVEALSRSDSPMKENDYRNLSVRETISALLDGKLTFSRLFGLSSLGKRLEDIIKKEKKELQKFD